MQRIIIQIFDSYPNGRFTVREVASMVYPGLTLRGHHLHTVNRSLHGLTSNIGLTKSRVKQPRANGWQHVWGKAA